MNVGLGDTELLSQDVQGDIDFDFFDGSEEPEKSCVEASGPWPESQRESKDNNGPIEPSSKNCYAQKEVNGANGGDEAMTMENCNHHEDNSFVAQILNNEDMIFQLDPNQKVDIIKKVDAFIESQGAVGPDGRILYSKLLRYFDLSPLTSESEHSSESLTTVSPLLSDHSSDLSSGGYTTEDFERELRERKEKEKEAKISGATQNGNCDHHESESETSESDEDEDESESSSDEEDNDELLAENENMDHQMKLVIAALNELKMRDEAKANSCQTNGRRNMSFSKQEVQKIDHENHRLLNRLVDIKNSKKSSIPAPDTSHSGPQVSSSSINRLKELKRVEGENVALLKRLKSAKPTKEVQKDHLLKEYEKTRNYGIAAESSKNLKSRQSTRPASATSSTSDKSGSVKSSSSSSQEHSSKQSKNRPEWDSRW